MRRILLLLLLASTCFALDVEWVNPSQQEYEHGVIPIDFYLKDNGVSVINEQPALALVKDGIVLETTLGKTLGYTYHEAFQIQNKGVYVIRVTNDGNVTEKEITITTSALLLDIITPVNASYETGEIEVKVRLSQNNEFMDQATVTGKIGEDIFNIPEGANYYYTTKEVSPGQHTLTVTVVAGEQTVSSSIDFVVQGTTVENGQQVPVPTGAIMEMHLLDPTQGQYPLGYKGEVNVFFTDYTGAKMKNSNITATANIKTPTQEYVEILEYKDDLLVPKYSADIMFSESGYYYVKVNAELQGYQSASKSFSPILVGEQNVPLPEGTECENDVCLNTMEPEEYGTYAMAEQAEIRVQVIEEEGNHNPITDTEVSATIGGTLVELEYEYNGMYVGALPLLEEGTYTIVFTASAGNNTVSKQMTVFISPHALSIKPIYPRAGDNVTVETVVLQVEVTDEAMDIVPGANTRVIVTSPSTGAHTIPLERNVETGYYEASYTFSDAGQHSMKVTTSKQGHVSGETYLVFEVAIIPEEFIFQERDLLVVLVSIGILVILITVGKALI